MATSIGFDVVAHDRASRTLGTIGRAADNSSTKWRRLGTAVKWAGRAVAGGLLLAAGAAVSFAKAAADDELSARLLADAMRNAAGATDGHISKVEDWITKISLATGVADDDLRPALSRLVTATGDVGKAQDLLKLSMDVAAGSGKSLAQVTEAMQKAQNGSITGLSRMGVAIKDAAGETKSFGKIQKELADLHGGKAATAASSTAGQYARLRVMASETGEALGYKLLPYAIKVGDWMLNKGIPAAQQLGGWLKDKLGPAVGAVADWFKKGTKSGGDLSEGMDGLRGMVDDGKRAWEALSPFIKDAAAVYFPALWKAVKLAAKAISHFGDVGIWMWNNVFSTVIHLLLDGFSAVTMMTADMLRALGKAPGMGWADKAADKLYKASAGAKDLGDKIKDIPPRKDVDIYVTTHRRNIGKPGPYDPEMDVGGRVSSKGGNPNVKHLGHQGAQLIASLVKGIKNGKKPLDMVLNAVTANLEKKVDKWKGLLSAKGEFAESFKGWAKNLFSAEGSTDAEGNSLPLTMADILKQSQGEKAKSASVKSDIATLLKLGMSSDLIAEMQAQGESGIEALHILAGASAAEIAELNANQAETMKNYGDAGMSAAGKVYDAQIKAAEADKVLAASLVDAVSALKNLEHVQFIVKGDDLVAVIKKHDKDKGK